MPSKDYTHGYWSTKQELNFIKKLGSHSLRACARRKLLFAYYTGIVQRDRWDGIDRDIIFEAVEAELDA